jgi:probable HAF family extracellular repeat protein
VNRSVKVLVVAGIAASLASFAAAQGYTFNVVKVQNSNPNVPTAINNAGQVLVDGGTQGALKVSLWNRVGGAQNLGLTGADNVGAALNNANDVAGAGAPGSGQVQAFLWQPGGNTTWLGTLGGVLSAASGVNTAREVVGTAFTAASLQHAFLWTSTSGMQDLTPNLTSPGGATATAINTAGEVVGYYYPNGATNVLGFSWTQAGGLQSFGAPGTMAFAINDAGTIVGQELTASGYRHAFSKTQSGGMVDLGTLGGGMSTAYAINNKGWIVGTSTTNDGSGTLHGFLWTPSGGMRDFTALANIGPQKQPYSLGINDYGDIAFTNKNLMIVLLPDIAATAVSSANPSTVGQPITITATLTSIAGPPPDGEPLQVSCAGQTATGTLKNGVAKVTLTGVGAGAHKVTLSYTGDAYYKQFQITALTQVVNAAAGHKR